MNNQNSPTIYCEHCGAKKVVYNHNLTPMLATVLKKVQDAVVRNNSYTVRVPHDLDLSKNEYNNFQKLRFHGLVAKTEKQGYWIFTHRGSEFLRGNIQIPKAVQTFRNRVIGHDEQLVSIFEVLSDNPYLQKDFTYEQQTLV